MPSQLFCREVIIKLFWTLFWALLLRKVNAHTKCHCIPLKSCQSLNERIEGTKNFTEISFLIKKSLCQFNGVQISVCCQTPKQSHTDGLRISKPFNFIFNSVEKFNCPASISDEFDYDDYVRTFHKHRKHTNNHFHWHIGNGDYYADYENEEDNGKDYRAENRTVMTTTVSQTTNSTARKDDNECGLIENNYTNENLYPWIARLAYLNITKMTVSYRCMGTSIDGKYILTAAHCVANLVQDIQLIYVRLGNDANYTDYNINRTIIHPNYNDPLFNNDIALIKLSLNQDVPLNDNFMKICLPENNERSSNIINNGLVAAWNRRTRANVSNVSYINLSVMNNTECAIRYARYSENFESSIIITPTQFCAHTDTLTDVCEGDSGGPFMSIDNSKRYMVIGIVAFGPNTNCGESNLPGVYTNVSSHIGWIKRSMV